MDDLHGAAFGSIADRILVFRKGKVVEEFSATEATEEKIMYGAIH